MKNKYQCCNQCIMDTSDPKIIFDDDGICNHCYEYQDAIKIDSNEKNAFKKQITNMHKIDSKYNCIIGLSGGLDSSFLLLHAVKDLGLKPLAVHVDNGWNTGLANYNIAKQLKILNIDLHTEVLDWEEFRLMQLAILDAGVPDLEAPTDIFINYSIRNIAKKYNIKYILFGTNPQTEAVMGSNWSYGQRDPIYLKNLYIRFTGSKSKKLPFHNWYKMLFRGMFKEEIVRPLKFIPFERKKVVSRCVKELGWVEYPRKHGESFITRFYQNYFLPVRFGFDKRRAHLSSLILNKDISKNDAIRILESEEIYKANTMAEIEYLCKKLQISLDMFSSYMNASKKYHNDYKNLKKTYLFIIGKYIKNRLGNNNFLYKKVVRLITH